MNRQHTYRWYSKLLTSLLWVMVVCLLVACSDDNEQLEQDEETLQLLPYSEHLSFVGSPATRALDGYEEYTAAPITAYLTPEGASRAAIYRYSTVSNRWNSGFKIKDNNTYYIYGFTPSDAVTGSSINFLSGDSYENGARLTLNGLKPVSDKDFCLIVGIRQVDSETTEVPSDFKPGNFKYEGRPKNQNFAYMMLHHIYGALSFTIKIDEKYNQLRKIKLKTMELKDVPSVYSTVTMDISKTSGLDPIGANSWTKVSETEDVKFFENNTGLELTTTAQPLTLKIENEDVEKIMVAQALSSNLNLVCTYDVYDTNNNLIRQNSKAENKLPGGIVNRGEWRTVNLTVNPTYLYVLSEPDLDNPSITMN